MSKKIILHFAVEYTKHGERRIRSLCNRARADIINTESIDSGQNVTDKQENVTCSFCQRILAAANKYSRHDWKWS